MKALKILFPLLILLAGCSEIKKWFPDDKEPVPEPTPVVTPVPTPEPTPVVTPTPVPTPKPTPVATPEAPKVAPYECSSFPKTSSAGGQFVNNPESEKGLLKIIWPNKYTNKIVDTTVWSEDKSYKEKLTWKEGNEYNDRQRYYGKKAPKDYPKPLIVGALLYDGTRVCVKLPDPTKRIDWKLG